MAGGADFNYQLLTFGLACGLLLLLMRAASQLPRARNAMGVILVLFVLGGAPLALEFYRWDTPWTHWKAFARRFAELPLTAPRLP
jgi:hypothetical protein